MGFIAIKGTTVIEFIIENLDRFAGFIPQRHSPIIQTFGAFIFVCLDIAMNTRHVNDLKKRAICSNVTTSVNQTSIHSHSFFPSSLTFEINNTVYVNEERDDEQVVS